MKVYNRIHINSIDMSKRGKLDSGGIGFSIDYSPMNVNVKKMHSDCIEVTGYSKRRVVNLVNELRKTLPINPLGWKIDVKMDLESHLGLGSTTQIDAAIVKLLCKKQNYSKLSLKDYYKFGIGRESGVGLKCFLKPGFHIDFGYLTNMVNGNQVKIKPIEDSLYLNLPNEWQLLLAIPKQNQSLSGIKEKEFWNDVLPLDQQHAKEISYWILMALVPSIQEENFDLFITSLNQIVAYGSKPDEVELNKNISADVLGTLRNETGFGGLTSLGPSCYTFINRTNFSEEVYERIIKQHPDFEFEIANIQYA